MYTLLRAVLIALLVLMPTVMLTGCEPQESDTEDAIEDMGEEMEDVGEEIGEGVEEAGEEIEEGVQ